MRISQAERVIRAFGGARKLADLATLLGYPIDVSSIYRWTHPTAIRGCGGRVPAKNWDWLFLCAEAAQVEIVPSMFDPREMDDGKKAEGEELLA